MAKKEEAKKEVTFVERQQLYQEELIAISEKYGIDLYAANVLTKAGEVVPLVKMFDRESVKKQKEDIVTL